MLRLVSSTTRPDEEVKQKSFVVEKRLVDDYGYDSHSARGAQLRDYAAGARVMAETRRSVCYLQFSHCLDGTDAALAVFCDLNGDDAHTSWAAGLLSFLAKG